MKTTNRTPAEEVADYIRRHPEKSWQQITIALGISYSSVSRIAKNFCLSRPVWMNINREALKK
jgi:DNA-binding MurR/RpiR family transcriptional regulator